jgi:hypothetical protein
MQWTPCPIPPVGPVLPLPIQQCFSLKTPLVGCLGEDMYLGNSSTLRFFPTGLCDHFDDDTTIPYIRLEISRWVD